MATVRIFETILPDDVCVAEGDPRLASSPLFPEERRLVERAVEKRQREFAKGRECARSALAQLGVEPCQVLSGPRREPLWPSGVVGSITHTAEFCAAVVASGRAYAGIGVDAEPDEPLAEDLLEAVGVAEELVVRCSPGFPRNGVARLLFSAKEAFFKCQYPLTRAFLEFREVTVELKSDGTFCTRVLAPRFPELRAVQGRWRRTGGLLLTSAWIARAR